MNKDQRSGSTSKLDPTTVTVPAAFGAEGWFKLVTIPLAFLYICGYGGTMGYSRALGLSPADLGMNEKDFLVQGIIFLLPDPANTMGLKSVWQILRATPLFVCFGFILLFPIIFAFPGKHRTGAWYNKMLGSTWFGIMFRSILLLPLGMWVLTASRWEGEDRADRAMSRASLLPTTMIGYHIEGSTNGPAFLFGSLVARNDKVVCIGLATLHVFEGQSISVGLEEKIFIIPTERILLMSAVMPANLPRQPIPLVVSPLPDSTSTIPGATSTNPPTPITEQTK